MQVKIEAIPSNWSDLVVVWLEEPRIYTLNPVAVQRCAVESRLRNVREAVQAVADAAHLGSGMSAVDITRGTTLAADVVRHRVGSRGQVFVLDRDIEWLAAIQARYPEADLRYSYADLGDWGDSVPGTVDRVVSAQALWWFHQADRILSAVSSRLARGGRFAFAIPGTYFDFGDGIQSPQWVFASVLAEFGQALPPPPPTLTKQTVKSRLAAAGLHVLRYRVREVESVPTEWEPGGELHGLMQIHPPAWPGHDLNERVERALTQLQRWGPELAGRQALWRHAVFSCVPEQHGSSQTDQAAALSK